MDSAMLVLLLALVGMITYLLFTPCKWLDDYAQEGKEQWTGEDIGSGFSSEHRQVIHRDQEGVPFVKTLDVPFNDPEVPNRPAKPKKKRKYKKRTKK